MEKRMVVITDDIDGSEITDPAHELTTLCLDGQAVALDLTMKNREKLEKALAKYLAAGAKVPSATHRKVKSTDELKTPAEQRKRKRRATAAA